MRKKALVGNASDEEQVARAKQTEKDRNKQHLDDLRDLVNSPSGERFFWWLFGETGIFHTAFARETNEMYFNTGRREIGLRLLADLTLAKPSALAEMLARAATEDAKHA